MEVSGDKYAAELVYVLSTEATLRACLQDGEGASDLLARGGAAGRAPAIPSDDSGECTDATRVAPVGARGLRKALAHLTQAAEELELNSESFVQRFFCQSVAGQLGHGKQAEEILRQLVELPTTPASPADVTRIAALIELGNVSLQRKQGAQAEAHHLRAQREIVPAGSPALLRFDIHQNLASTHTRTWENSPRPSTLRINDIRPPVFFRAQLIRDQAVCL